MKYLGSKRKIAKEILPIILKDRHPKQWYVEPFCGGCNTLSEVNGYRLGNDINYYLIKMWQAVSTGWYPPVHITEEDYNKCKKNNNLYAPEIVGYMGFALSYGGKWFGGWRRDSEGKRNYVEEAYRSAREQFPKLWNVEFTNKQYYEMNDCDIPCDSIVYCDPHYKGTTGHDKDFDHDMFWDWCKLLSKRNKVFISEYSAPDDFDCIWSKSVYNTLEKNTGAKTGVEKLFIYRL